MVAGEKGGGIDWETRIDTYTLLYTKYITNKNITQGAIQHSAVAYVGKEPLKEWIYAYI